MWAKIRDGPQQPKRNVGRFARSRCVDCFVIAMTFGSRGSRSFRDAPQAHVMAKPSVTARTPLSLTDGLRVLGIDSHQYFNRCQETQNNRMTDDPCNMVPFLEVYHDDNSIGVSFEISNVLLQRMICLKPQVKMILQSSHRYPALSQWMPLVSALPARWLPPSKDY